MGQSLAYHTGAMCRFSLKQCLARKFQPLKLSHLKNAYSFKNSQTQYFSYNWWLASMYILQFLYLFSHLLVPRHLLQAISISMARLESTFTPRSRLDRVNPWNWN